MDHLQRIKQEFARQAAGFATSAALTERAPIQRIIDATGADATSRALDLACGPGIVTAQLAVVTGEVVGFDLTPEMLAKARERCSKANLQNVTFQEGSATQLPFPDNHFDVVVTRAAIHHFREPGRILGEAMRVMRRGAVLVVADVVSSERSRNGPGSSPIPSASIRCARSFERWRGLARMPEWASPPPTVRSLSFTAGS
jgi:ubiquinone/menaquinone biosynthesis C-methylase UbiE